MISCLGSLGVLAEVLSYFPEMTSSLNRYCVGLFLHTHTGAEGCSQWRSSPALLQPGMGKRTLAPLTHAIRQLHELILQSSMEEVLTSCHSSCSSTLTWLLFLSLKHVLI